MAKIRLKILKDAMTFRKGSGRFSLRRETTRQDLERYFELAGITHIISSFKAADDGWEFVNKEGQRACCTHRDLIEKLNELEQEQ